MGVKPSVAGPTRPESKEAKGRPAAGKCRLSHRQELFIVTFILILGSVAFMHLAIQLFNNEIMHLDYGKCCRAYDTWKAINPASMLEWVAFAAAVSAVAAYALI